eukprot:gene20096-39714_t
MNTEIANLSSWLREAIKEAKASGLSCAAIELEARAFATYTTSSEWLGEAGLTITAFLQKSKGSVPPSTEAKLIACITEIKKVWPGLAA